MKKFDVIVLSTFSKGIWLANQLAAQEKSVAYIDFSNEFPSQSIEDIIGPFGFFLDPNIDFFQTEWWRAYWRSSKDGFCVVTDSMPFHFKNTFLYPTYEKHTEFSNLRKHIANNKKSLPRDFQENWLIYLLNNLSSGVDHKLNDKALCSPLLTFNEFGVLENLADIKELDPKVHLLRAQKNSFEAIFSENEYIFSYQDQSLRSSYLASALNPEEARIIGASFYKKLFSKKNIHPSWHWQRFAFDFRSEGYTIPDHLVIASKEYLPWTHERLLILNKSTKFKNQMNVWARIPFSVKNNQDLTELSKPISAQLKQTFPGFLISNSTLVSPSTESRFLFPIYSEKTYKNIHINKNKTFFQLWCGEALNWNQFALRERAVLEKILSR